MPCEDTTSSISVRIGPDDRLLDYSYEKLTCGKMIGAGEEYKRFSIGRRIEEIAEAPFSEVPGRAAVKDSEEEFLLHLEWKALREALRQYLGLEGDSDSERFKIAEIITGKEGTTIEMIINPPGDLPPVVPCHELH